MASARYTKGNEGILDQSINLVGNDIMGVFLDATYVPNILSDYDLGDLTGIVATVGPLTGKSVTAGVFDADDIDALAVSGPQVTQFVLYQTVGSPATTRLIAYWDNGIGMPFVPSGLNVPIQWDNGANKIFAL